MKNFNTLLFVLGVSILVGWPKCSHADDRWGHHGTHRYYHYHDHPRFGLNVAAFYPDEYYPVWAGGARYYYDDGVYYSDLNGDYIVAAPPAGAVVSTIPSDFQPVLINGVTYYTDNGTYYMHTPNGYQVVAPPVPMSSGNTPNAITVNVPKDGGGYASVTLKRAGNGFVGPQGEFYAQFPKVSQLQSMYGK